MKIYPYLFCISILQLFNITAHAQSDINLSTLKAPLTAITIDGNLKEWGDSLQYYDADLNSRYALSNDKDNIYFAIRIDDPSEAIRVLKAGISFGVDPKGKKKPAYNITFPLNLQELSPSKNAPPNNFGEITQADRDELHRLLITTLRGIKVEGFKDIETDIITTSNTYGIKVAVDYDVKGNLVCEAAIPLKFFHAEANSKTEWAFAVKINGITNPNKNRDDNDLSSHLGGGQGMGGGGRGGMGGGRGGGRGGRSNTATLADANNPGTLGKSVDFSGKFYLATVK